MKGNVFRPEFLAKLNEAVLESVNNMGRIKPRLLGTISGAFTDIWTGSLSKLVKAEGLKELLDTEIWASGVAGGHGFATGVYQGRRIIVMQPEQAEVDYVPGLLHEVKHVIDILNGKEVSITNEPGDRRLPSERRARDFEKRFVDRMYSDSLKMQA